MSRNWFSIWRIALLSTGLLVPSLAQAQQLTHTCKFDRGPRAGLTLAYPTLQPIPVGAPCRDGVASTGLAVPDNPHPQLTHTCKFDQGPRTGQTQVYPQSMPVGASCWDGVSSAGVTIADNTSAPEPAKPPVQNPESVAPQKQPTQAPVRQQEIHQQVAPGHDQSARTEPAEPPGKSGLISKALAEAEAFKQLASVPDARNNFLLHMGIDGVLYALRAAKSSGDEDKTSSENVTGLRSGARNIGDFMKIPGGKGNDQWLVLCLDIANLIASSGYRMMFYCPTAEAVFAKMYPLLQKQSSPEPAVRQDTPQTSQRDSPQVPSSSSRQPIQRQDTSAISRGGNASNELTAEATGTGTLQDQVNTGVKLYQNLADRDPFNQRIQAARKRYFRDLPSAPDLPAAKHEFQQLLHDKNVFYLMQVLTNAQSRSLSPLGTPNIYKSVMAPMETEIDGGIPEQAWRSFANWRDAIIAKAFPHSNPQDVLKNSLDPTILIDAMASSTDRMNAYYYSLGWAEYERSGLDLRKIWTPKDYALRMMAWNLLERPIRPGLPVPDPVQDPANAYNTMSAILGEKVLLDAAAKALAAKRNSAGWLDIPVQVDVPNFAYRSSSGQQFWFDSLLANSSDRAYAICIGRKFSDSPLPYAAHPIAYGDAWQEGANWYAQLVREHGEPAVLAAAHKVRISPKSPDGHRIICSQQYCYSPNIFLEAILKDSSITAPPPVPRFKVTEIGDPQSVEARPAVILTGVIANAVQDPNFASRAIITFEGVNPPDKLWCTMLPKPDQSIVGKSVEIFLYDGSWTESPSARNNGKMQCKITDKEQVTVLPSPK
jgi:hypothetical protein